MTHTAQALRRIHTADRPIKHDTWPTGPLMTCMYIVTFVQITATTQVVTMAEKGRLFMAEAAPSAFFINHLAIIRHVHNRLQQPCNQ